MTQATPIVSGPGPAYRSLSQIGEQPPRQIDRIDLSESFAFFRRRLKLIAACIVLALLAGIAISYTTSKTYSTAAVVSLRQHQAAADGVANDTGGAPAINNGFVDTQIEVITSREMASRVAEALGLLDGLSEEEQRWALDDLQYSVWAHRSGESFALTIGYDGPDAAEATRRANEYARQFTQWEINQTKARTKESIAKITSRLAELKAQAQADTRALQQYRISNNLLSTSGASLTEQEISSYNQQVAQARAEAAEDQARLDTALAQLRSGSSGDDLGEALGSTVIASLRTRESEIGGQVANLSSRYGPNHPQLIRATGELGEVRSQIDAEIQRIVSNLRAKREVSRQRLASLTGTLSAARGKLSQNNAAMVGLDELQRDAQTSQGLYETYLNSYKQLVASEGTERANAQILSLAEKPYLPSSPNIPLNMILALAIGLGGGLVAAFVVESFAKSIRSSDQVERDLGQRYLASIPLLSSVAEKGARPVTAIGKAPRSAFAESFRALRTSVLQAANGPSQVIAITSALPREGKTVTSTCLAQTIALSGSRTILIDCDETRRGVSRLLDISSDQPGLIEILSGEAKLEDALIETPIGLSILPVTTGDSTSDEWLAGKSMDTLIDELRARYDNVILDLPPILPAAISRSLAAKADVTVMVARWCETSSMAIKSAIYQLPSDQINLVGIAMTQVDMRKVGLLSDSDPSYYFSKYREYYS